MKKIKTLKKLIKAYESGELNRKTDLLTIDNDTVYVYREIDDGEDAECVFESHPSEVVEESLKLLKIPFEYC